MAGKKKGVPKAARPDETVGTPSPLFRRHPHDPLRSSNTRWPIFPTVCSSRSTSSSCRAGIKSNSSSRLGSRRLLMREVTKTCADRPSAIVQGALAQFDRGIEFAGEANVKQRGSPVSPGAGYGQKILDTLRRELSWSHHRLLEAVGRRKKR